jgi:aldehyde dehydrogenase (NAD+)
MNDNSPRFYIDGQWIDSLVANRYEVINPATEEAAGLISLGPSTDVDRAVAATRRAFPPFHDHHMCVRRAMPVAI